MTYLIQSKMASNRYVIALAILCLPGTGCTNRKPKPVPAYPRPVAMTVLLEEGFEIGLGKLKEFEIKLSGDIAKVYEQVKPTRWCDLTNFKSVCPLVARVIAKHADGSTTELFVRDAGVNPALVSFDDTDFFWADGGMPGAGATNVLRLLNPDNKLLGQ